MRFCKFVAVLIMLVALAPAWCQAQEETSLIAVLGSDAANMEKIDACHRLKAIGTAAAVSALAACLTNDELSHPARQALESMPCAEAGEALMSALSDTSGMNRAGIIESLGLRRETKAIPALSGLLSDPDAVTASAAARALGRIGTPEVVPPLQALLGAGDTSVRAAAADALLRCAERLLAEGQTAQALDISTRLYEMDLPERFRVAAYRARILAAGDGMLDLAIAGITGTDRAARLASLNLARELPGEAATSALTETLTKVDAPIQIALLQSLGQRGDTAALPGVTAAASSDDPAVRLAALDALGILGDQTTVALLTRIAANGPEPERDAARQALSVLRRGDVHGAMIAALSSAPPLEQVELTKALAVRRDVPAVAALIELAGRAEEPVRIAAVKALAVLADDATANRLIDLIGVADSQAVRDAAEDAVVRVASKSDAPAAIEDALLEVQATAPVPARMAVLTAAARIDFARALPTLRAAVQDANPEVRGGAVRILAQYCGPESLDDLLALAAKAPDETERTLVLRGYWRVMDNLEGRSPEDRLKLVQAGLAQAQSIESRKSGIAMLSDVPLKAALEIAEQSRADQAVKAEAELATYAIAGSLLYADRAAADQALRNLADSAIDEALRAKAAALVAALSQNTGFIVPWLISGPYRQEGKQAQQLFDIPFAPEQPGGGNAVWTLQPVPADPANFWQVDLANVVGGDHCVVYLKTQVVLPNGGETILEIGSDDGIKLWVNDQLVHANNAVRGFAPASDHATVTLKPGPNTFFAKITQHTLGCAMAIRIPAPEGAPNEPLRIEPR